MEVAGLAVGVRSLARVGKSLTVTGRDEAGFAEQIEGGGFAAAVGQGPVDSRCFLGEREDRLGPPEVDFHPAQRQGCAGDPGRIGSVTAGLQGQCVRGQRLCPERPGI